MIKAIEIICKPCHKCEVLGERIRTMIKCMEFKYALKIKYEFQLNPNIRDAERYGYNASQLPLVLINGMVAFAGYVKQEHVVRMKLEEFHRGLV